MNDNQIKNKSSRILLARIKAFIIDVFMIYIPILYIFYIALGSKEAFLNNHLVIFICVLLYAFITSLLLFLKSQTLGYRYAEIKLIRNDGKKVGFILVLFRFFVFCFSMSFLFGFFVPFMNKNRNTFHDFITKTSVIEFKNTN